MSTTFGVYIGTKTIELEDDCLPEDADLDDFVKIAFRGNSGGIWFTNPIANLLSNDTKVFPLDNSAQGIYTIEDIKNKL